MHASKQLHLYGASNQTGAHPSGDLIPTPCAQSMCPQKHVPEPEPCCRFPAANICTPKLEFGCLEFRVYLLLWGGGGEGACSCPGRTSALNHESSDATTHKPQTWSHKHYTLHVPTYITYLCKLPHIFFQIRFALKSSTNFGNFIIRLQGAKKRRKQQHGSFPK